MVLDTGCYTDSYTYTAPGEVATKQWSVTRTWQVGTAPYPNSTLNFSASYTWDNEGKMTGVNYPVLGACGGMACGSGTTNGPTYTFGFDTMSRLNAMTRTDGTAATIANNVVYNVADQMTSLGMPLGGNGTESRSYNSLFRLTNITRTWNTATQMNLTYNYTAGSDNGKIASMTGAVSGETVSYAYDSLNRLISATAKSGTTTVWGNSFGFDGFGNLLSKTVTGGTAPTLSQTVNTVTNHINAYTYDSNGNQTTVPVAGSGNVNAGYDIQNRMTLLGSVGSPTAQYAYGAANQRVWRMATESGTTKEWFYFYGIDGQRMASYQVTVVTPVQGNSYTSAVTVQAADVLVYFGRKMLMEGSWSGIGSFSASYVGVDRLGSIPGGAKLFAWGEEVTATANDKIKFATYLRDGESGIDYGMNRYYGSGVGRFLTADPSPGSAGSGTPSSWNRYAYATGDPANRLDPVGKDACAVSEVDFDVSWECPGDQDYGCPARDGTALLPEAPLPGGLCVPLLPILYFRPLPEYLVVTFDCYVAGSIAHHSAQRDIGYQLIGTDGLPFTSATVTEHLGGDLPISGPTLSGRPGGFFLDSQSILLGKAHQHLTQQFTAETIYNYVDPPVTVSVFVRGFGGDFGTLSIEKYPNVVFINGDSGLDSRGRPKHICGQGE